MTTVSRSIPGVSIGEDAEIAFDTLIDSSAPLAEQLAAMAASSDAITLLMQNTRRYEIGKGAKVAGRVMLTSQMASSSSSLASTIKRKRQEDDRQLADSNTPSSDGGDEPDATQQPSIKRSKSDDDDDDAAGGDSEKDKDDRKEAQRSRDGYYCAEGVPAGLKVVYDSHRDLFFDESMQVLTVCCKTRVPPSQQNGAACLSRCKDADGKTKRCCRYCGFEQDHSNRCEHGGDLYCSKDCMPKRPCECGGWVDEGDGCGCFEESCSECGPFVSRLKEEQQASASAQASAMTEDDEQPGAPRLVPAPLTSASV